MYDEFMKKKKKASQQLLRILLSQSDNIIQESISI